MPSGKGRKMRRIVMTATALVMGLSAVSAQDTPNFQGKQITIVIGSAPGGGTDLSGRLIANTIASHLPGKPTVIVRNIPGAQGVTSMNFFVKQVAPDGLTMTMGSTSQADPLLYRKSNSLFDPTKFIMVGGAGRGGTVLMIRKESEPRLYDKSKPPVIMGSLGGVPRSGMQTTAWGIAVLGWNAKWVVGYPGTSELLLALDRGEIDMTAFGSSHDIEYLQKIGDFVVASQSGAIIAGKSIPRSAFGSAPIISDLLKGKITDPIAQQAFEYGEQVVQAGMWVALPPSTPDATVNAYIQAYDKAIAEPQYQAEWVRIDPDSPNASRDDLEAMIRKLGAVSDEALGFIRDELRRQGMEVAK